MIKKITESKLRSIIRNILAEARQNVAKYFVEDFQEFLGGNWTVEVDPHGNSTLGLLTATYNENEDIKINLYIQPDEIGMLAKASYEGLELPRQREDPYKREECYEGLENAMKEGLLPYLGDTSMDTQNPEDAEVAEKIQNAILGI